jgi:hypothetical protein
MFFVSKLDSERIFPLAAIGPPTARVLELGYTDMPGT